MPRHRVEVMITLLGNSIKVYEESLFKMENTEPIDEKKIQSYKMQLKEKYQQLDELTIEKSILFNIDTKPAFLY